MEWEKHYQDQQQQEQEVQFQPHQEPPHRLQQILEGGQPSRSANSGSGVGEAAPAFVKVMTDEQMEILQKQIVAYATICEQLENLHRSLTSSHYDHPNTDYMQRNIVNPYLTPLMTPSYHHHSQYYYGQPKIPRRQRWNPSPDQLQILEQMFDQGNEAPAKERIKNITTELAKHGQIAETNVYNWFQNRRARFKKKQMMSAISESKGEMVSDTSSKSIGKNLKSSEQLVTSICIDKDTMQQSAPMFSTADSLKATGGGGGGGADGSFGDMAGRILSSKSNLDYSAVTPDSYYH